MERIVLQIVPEDSVRSVQEKFSSLYPFLRLNIFRKNKGKSTPDGCFSPEVRMEDINKNFRSSSYELGDYTTVAELEKALGEKFGLSVQVSRRCGNLWLETRLTDHLTLDEQNSIGEEITSQPLANLPFANVPYGC